MIQKNSVLPAKGDLAPLALNREAAAKALGVSLPTLDRFVVRGLLRPSRACRRPLFSLEELKRFLLVTTNAAA